MYKLGIQTILKSVIEGRYLRIFLDEHRIKLEDQIIIFEKDLYNEIITVMKNNEKIVIPLKVARKLFLVS